VFAAVCFAIVHVALVECFVPASKIFSDQPVHGIDYDLHVGQIFQVVEALDRWGKSWSYNVELLAGHPAGVITDSGSKGWELYTFLLVRMGVPKIAAFNSFVLLMMWAFPLFIYGAARNFALPRGGALVASVMASTLLLFDSHVHWLWFVGMISWCGAASLALLCLSVFYRWTNERKPALAALSAGLLSVALLIHPYVFFVLALPMGATYLRVFRTRRWQEHAGLLGMAALALATNAYWLHNSWKHWHYILNSAVYAQASPEHLLFDFVDVMHSYADTGMIGTRTGFRFLYLGLSVAGLNLWWRQRDRRQLPFLCGIVGLYGLAYFGCFVPAMQQTQPYRQITPAMLFTTIPAAALVVDRRVARALMRLMPTLKLALGVLVVALVQQLLAIDVLYFFPALVSEASAGHREPETIVVSKYGYPRASGQPEHALFYAVPHSASLEFESGSVLSWIEENVPERSRVLVEEATLGERLAWHGRHEVMGGFFERNMQHVDANYFRSHFGKRVETAELRHYIETFAVEWIVTQATDFDGQEELLEHVETVRDRQIYRVIIPVNRVLQGGGTVRASTNMIEVRDSDPNRSLLLSYHWHPALRCRPECAVERADIDIDRVGFVRVPAPHAKNLTVWNSYETW
jgi:hypothetical protein